MISVTLLFGIDKQLSDIFMMAAASVSELQPETGTGSISGEFADARYSQRIKSLHFDLAFSVYSLLSACKASKLFIAFVVSKRTFFIKYRLYICSNANYIIKTLDIHRYILTKLSSLIH